MRPMPLVLFLFATSVAATAALTGCTAAPADDDAELSEADLTSARLEKSRIQVFVDQKNATLPASGDCAIESVRFRITYDNGDLPSGTKLVVRVGESTMEQEYIGDGFGWGEARERDWQRPRDVPMTPDGSRYTAEIEGQPYGKMTWQVEHPSGIGGWISEQKPARIQFVFRIELPDGSGVWDNRLNQDYSATAFAASCASGSTPGFVAVASWGPF